MKQVTKKDKNEAKNTPEVRSRVIEMARASDWFFDNPSPYTPEDHISSIISHLGDLRKKKILVMFTLEMATQLLSRGCMDITVATGKECKTTRYLALKMNCSYMLLEELAEAKMKFDLVMGNPPYQESSNSGNPVWPGFVEKGIDLLEEGGTLAMIHPPGWRGTGKTNKSSLESLRKKLKGMDIKWLSIHDISEGTKNFKASTRYDMYVAINRHTDNHVTEIRDEKRKTFKACIKGMDFIPNFDIKLVQGLISCEGGGGRYSI